VEAGKFPQDYIKRASFISEGCPHNLDFGEELEFRDSDF
jgi:hypothetical protein